MLREESVSETPASRAECQALIELKKKKKKTVCMSVRLLVMLSAVSSVSRVV